MSDWITCTVCDEEFKILALVGETTPEYCPFCGSELDLKEEDYEEDEED